MKTYTISPAGFEQLRNRLSTQGISITGPVGEIEFRGIMLKYFYDQERGQLTLSILKKPFLVTAGLIWEQVDGWIKT
jgi:hypothetical protein